MYFISFFFQAEDGIRDIGVTGVQTCALPICMFPLLWIFKMSIITKSELFASPPTILPQSPTGGEYTQIFSDPAFQKALLNSAIISGVTTVVCLFFGSIAAYAIARLRFRFKRDRKSVV